MTYKTVIFAGQSNALGFGMDLSTLPTHLALPNPHAYIFNAWGQWWGQLTPGVNTGTPAAPQAWGPEAEFAYQYGLDHPGEILLIIKSVKGGSGLAAHNTLPDWSPNVSGDLFDITTDAIDRAAAALSGGGMLQPSALFWMQGESDAANQVSALAYETNFTEFVEAARNDWLEDADGYIGFGRINDSSALAYHYDVRQAQLDVDVADANAESFRTADWAMQADDLHYAASGIVNMGAAFYDNWAI